MKNDHSQIKLPSPEVEVKPDWLHGTGVKLFVKRDDLIHPFISGNKWRKLMGYFQGVDLSKFSSISSLGGGFSNHLLALAFWGHINGVKTRGYVRAEEIEKSTPTTWMCFQWGMELIPISRNYSVSKLPYDSREYYIPMGGEDVPGLLGTSQMVDELTRSYDVMMCSMGTGTTLSGMAISASCQKIIGVPALKGGSYLKPQVENFLKDRHGEATAKSIFEQIDFWTEEHLGGFAKISEGLIRFINQFYLETQIPLDPIYTGKAMWALSKRIKEFPEGTRILFWHTGGVFGGIGMNNKLKNKGLQIEYLSKEYPIVFPDIFPSYHDLMGSKR